MSKFSDKRFFVLYGIRIKRLFYGGQYVLLRTRKLIRLGGVYINYLSWGLLEWGIFNIIFLKILSNI